jgi:peptide/nickel transport system substrate-binding protein
VSRPSTPLWLALALVAAAGPWAGQAADLPTYGGELRVGLPLPPRVSDPALVRELQDQWLARALHDTPLRAGAGALEPGLLAAVPEPLGGGRTFRLTLREGLRFADGTPLGARDLAASLARLLRPETGSPHAWVAVAIQGADEVVAGRAAALSGVQVLSERELLVTLSFDFLEFPRALAALPAAVVSPTGAGAGPFRREGRDRLVASDLHWRGRPYADALTFSSPDPRAAARALEAGQLELSVRPEVATGGAELPWRAAVFAAVNGRRLGAGAAPVRRVLASLDRVDLVRRFVRASAWPLHALLPAALLGPAEPAPAPPPAGPPPARLTLIAAGWSTDARAVAERVQVRLFDAGIRAALEPLDQASYAARLAAGDYDVALVAVPLLTTQPALAAGQVAGAVGGPRAARRAEQALASADRGEPLRAAAEALRAELDLWPLYTATVSFRIAAGVRGAAPFHDGTVDPGDLWRAPAAPP